MGFNPRFRMWSTEDWQGYCPTIGDMARRGWTLTKLCPACNLKMAVKIDGLIARHGRDWTPWGLTAPCPRLFCRGRMRLRGYSPRAGEYVDI